MEAVRFDIPWESKAEDFHIYCLGDIHCGTKHCCEEAVAEIVKQIKKDDHAYWVDMGDKGEFITPDDKRFDAGVIASWCKPENVAHDQESWYCDMFSPIKKKCIGSHLGNHEWNMKLHHHGDVHKNICDKLKIRDLGYTCFLSLGFALSFTGNTQRRLYKGVTTHGGGGAVTDAGKRTKLRQFMQRYPEHQFFAMGHMHDVIIEPGKSYLTTNSVDKIVGKEKLGAVTGCFFRTYTQGVNASYGEVRQYDPTGIGCAILHIKPYDGTMQFTREMVKTSYVVEEVP